MNLISNKCLTKKVLCHKFRIIISVFLLIIMCEIKNTNGRIIHRIRDYNEAVPVLISQCRSTCLEKFMNNQSNILLRSIDRECTKRPNCFMCWDYCRIIYEERQLTAKKMCNDIFCVSCLLFIIFYFNIFCSLVIY